jgi:chromosome partitioning protein
METIVVANRKGGSGKTTTALNLGAGLARHGHRVLLVDLDSQGSLTDTARVSTKAPNLMHVLTGEAEIQEAIRPGAYDVLPASPALAGADKILDRTGKEYLLSEALEAVKDNYDFIILDTPAALDLLTVNALVAADSMIITAQADRYNLEPIKKLKESLDAVRKYCNNTIKIKGVLITRYKGNTVLNQEAKDYAEKMAATFNTHVFDVPTRETIRVPESQQERMDIFTYMPAHPVTADFEALVDAVRGANNE